MVAQAAVWHGTEDELNQLTQAAARNCRSVQVDDNGNTLPCGELCAAHALLRDQRALNGLLFARRMRGRWRVKEHSR